MTLWLSKPVYEVLPYFYLLAGLLLMGAARLLDDEFWPEICTGGGALLVATGVSLWWYRRNYRRRH